MRRLVAVGGGTQGGLWTQIVCDVTGRAQEVPELTIGASYGDALMAAIGVRSGRARHGLDPGRPTVTPDPGSRAVYDTLFAHYTSLYRNIRTEVHALAGLQRAAAT